MGDILEEDERRLALPDDACDVRPEVAWVGRTDRGAGFAVMRLDAISFAAPDHELFRLHNRGDGRLDQHGVFVLLGGVEMHHAGLATAEGERGVPDHHVHQAREAGSLVRDVELLAAIDFE